jgi:hyperosmotically inducible protein
MKARFAVATLALLVAATPALAQRDTLQIYRDVEKQVLRYPHFTIFDSVHAQIDDDGVLTLTGKVTMPYKREDIAKRVARVAGIETVRNQIDVLPVSQFDNELRFRVARAIYSNPNFQPFARMVNPPVHIIVEHGRVTLEGVVQSEVDRMVARSIASSFLAFDVKNNLKTVAEVRAEGEKI